MKPVIHPWRWLVLAAAIGMFGLSVACGKKQSNSVEQGPRVIGLQGANAGLTMTGQTGSNMRVTMVSGEHTLSFDTSLSQTPSFSAPQRIENIDYVLQAVCIDVYCDRVGFLLTMTQYGYSAGGNTVTNGYGGTREQVIARSAKAYLFRENVQGNLEQVAIKTGNYQNISEAMVDIGAFN